jgi:hypothetical protein
MPTLRFVFLGGNKLGRGSLERLHEAPFLFRMGLGRLPVTNLDLERWARTHTKLRELSVHDTPVSDAGIAHLAKLTGLESLNVEGTSVSAAGVAALQKALPRCKIKWRPEQPATK